MSSAIFPSDLKELTPATLTSILIDSGREVAVSDIQIAEWARCGDGVASTADRVSLDLQYSKNEEELPNRVVLKTILLHRYLRFGLPMIISLSKTLNGFDKVPVLGRFVRPFVFTLINIYQKFFPHAPESMYANEVKFYSDIRPEIDIEAPKVYGSVFDENTGQFGVIMEDLGLRHAHFPNATESTPLEQVKYLTTVLAKLHAKYWNSPRLEGDLSWLPTRSSGGMFPVFDAIGLDLIRDQVAKNPFKQDLLAPLNKTVDELWDEMWAVQQELDKGPQTLLHGDTHIGNTYLLPDNKAGLLDWQLMVKGHWAQDLTYMIITGLDTATRREHETEIFDLYLQTLAEYGVENPPDKKQTYMDYRRSVCWALVIGWLITPPQNYGEAITSANISRIVNAALDLDSFNTLK